MEKEQLAGRDHLDHLGFLANKLKVLGEYLTVMEADEMISDTRNDYQDMGELIYHVSGEILETLEGMWKIRREVRRAA